MLYLIFDYCVYSLIFFFFFWLFGFFCAGRWRAANEWVITKQTWLMWLAGRTSGRAPVDYFQHTQELWVLAWSVCIIVSLCRCVAVSLCRCIAAHKNDEGEKTRRDWDFIRRGCGMLFDYSVYSLIFFFGFLTFGIWGLGFFGILEEGGVEGCCRGGLDAVSGGVGMGVGMGMEMGLVLVCGALRLCGVVRICNAVQCMAVPQKYRKLGGVGRWDATPRHAYFPFWLRVRVHGCERLLCCFDVGVTLVRRRRRCWGLLFGDMTGRRTI